MWKKGKGFTLIELMVVIAIILILALIAIPAYRNMQDRAKRSRVQSDLRNLATALQVFYTDWGKYPYGDGSRLAKGTIAGDELTGGENAVINISNAVSATGEVGQIIYIEQLPIDPFSDTANASYFYLTDGSGSTPVNGGTKYIMWSSASDVEHIFRDSSGNAGITNATPAPSSLP